MKYTELDVWQQAVALALNIYAETANLPNDERFGLTAQMRRASVSIASNVAEGEGRRFRRDNAKFVLAARGSLYELHTQLVICERLGYISLDASGKLTSH